MSITLLCKGSVGSGSHVKVRGREGREKQPKENVLYPLYPKRVRQDCGTSTTEPTSKLQWEVSKEQQGALYL